jgi:hypothetical protein
MAFKGKHIVCSKIVIDGLILEQVKQFNYLGCKLNIDGEPDLEKKSKKTRSDTQIKFIK